MLWLSRHSLLRSLTALAAALSMATVCAEPDAASTPSMLIKMGTIVEQPLVTADRRPGLGGYLGDHLRALKEQGLVQFELSFYEDSIALTEALRAGLVDAAVPLFEQEGLEDFARHTAPLETFSVGIFASSNQAQDNPGSWETSTQRVAVVRNSYVHQSTRQFMPRAQLHLAGNAAAAFTALASNQVDYVVLSLIRALHTISEQRLPHIVLAGYAPFSVKFSIAVANDKPEVLHALQAAISNVPAAQTDNIRKRWMTQLEKPWYQRTSVIPWLILLTAVVVATLLGALVMRCTLRRQGAKLYQTQQLLDRTSRSALVGGWQYDVASQNLTWTEQAHLIYGTSPQTFKPSLERCLQLVDEESLPAVRKAFLECASDGTPFEVEFKLRTESGGFIWATATGQAESQSGKVTQVFGSLRNIDELKRQQHHLERSEKLYRSLAEGASDLVSVHDRNGMCLYASASIQTLTGFSPAEVVGTQLEGLEFLEDRTLLVEMLVATRHEAAVQERTSRIRCKNGAPRWFEHRASLLEGSELQGEVLVVSRDITERLATQEHFRHIALHDSLTGLPNRLALSQRLADLALGAPPDGTRLALCLLDIDNLKAINNTLGRPAGDNVLKEFARRISTVTNGKCNCMVSRSGGNEFVVLLSSCEGAATPEVVADALLKAFVAPIDMVEGCVSMTASVGIAVFPDDAISAEGLLSAASAAMYAAKTEGRNRLRRYTREIGLASIAQAQALQDVRGAYERKELELFYQPKIELESDRISGVEALLRWRTPDGYRGPVELIAAAEESGFIRTLGRWVLETAALQSLEWKAQGIDCPTAVNVSVRQLHDEEFVEHLTALVERSPELAERLELEITETAIATDADIVVELLKAIRLLGVKVHIDDFGTGYSSLSYLGRLPVSTLKIDKSLVSATATKWEAREIVRAIVALAKSLGLETIAEGVETTAHAAFLRKLGCTHAQGYLYAKPMPANDAANFYRLRQGITVQVSSSWGMSDAADARPGPLLPLEESPPGEESETTANPAPYVVAPTIG